tara:strand:- start:2442 stop:2894 length:453 start_codon:yes stop_codon:yes gene_type:complete
MARYASGKDAYGISDRSGFRYRLRDMKTEWNGMKVGFDEYEEKHPQLEPRRRVVDPQALRDPRPENNKIPTTVSLPVFSTETLRYVTPVFMTGKIGNVTFSGAVVTPTQPTGVSVLMGLGSVTVSTSVSASTFDSTSVTLDSSNKTFDEG